MFKIRCCLFLNEILFSNLFTYIFIEGLLSLNFCPCFFNEYSKFSSIYDTEYDPSGNSNSLFYIGTHILNLLFDEFLIFFHV